VGGKRLKGGVLQSAFTSGGKYYAARTPCEECLVPTRRTHRPAISGNEARETILGEWSREIVAYLALVFQKISRENCGYRVRPRII
jgi:hypothetical protein